LHATQFDMAQGATNGCGWIGKGLGILDGQRDGLDQLMAIAGTIGRQSSPLTYSLRSHKNT
jgi:hypothetical protein